ncbi:MAG: hypothetical protein Q8861_07545 [Bacteroidota bacterium]|nr:hypothetical protein [Bacteroidota bacterium]
MKTNKIFRIIFLSIIIIVIWNIIGYIVEKTFRENITSKKKMYCYEQYDKNVVNPVLYVEKRVYIDSLIDYYQKMEHGNMTPMFNFPINSMPYDTCVYVIGYERDSLVAEVICYYDWGNTGSYRRGYVYRNTLHLNPPPKDRILKK